MKPLFDACWRAAGYCLHPQVIALSLLPLLISGGVLAALIWLYGAPASEALRAALTGWSWVQRVLGWLDPTTAARVMEVLAPLLLLLVAAPLVVVMSLLLVAVLMTPSIVTLVSRRRFPVLERKHGAGMLRGLLWSLACTVVALAALVLSLPLWLIPPLALVLPPLIWGWLTYRVMAFDVLAEHASGAERRALMQRHRGPMLAIGVISGYLGAAPTLLFAFSAFTLVALPVLAPLAVWLYTLIFAFSGLWFAHFCLAALQALRAEADAAAAAARAPAAEVVDVPVMLPPRDATPVLPPPAAPGASSPTSF